MPLNIFYIGDLKVRNSNCVNTIKCAVKTPEWHVLQSGYRYCHKCMISALKGLILNGEASLGLLKEEVKIAEKVLALSPTTNSFLTQAQNMLIGHRAQIEEMNSYNACLDRIREQLKDNPILLLEIE